MRNMKFVDARAMNVFGVINITNTREPIIKHFVEALQRAGREMG